MNKTIKKSQKKSKYKTLLFTLLFFNPGYTLEVTGELLKKYHAQDPAQNN